MLKRVVASLIRLLLGLRYKITVSGGAQCLLNRKGVLVLPNHPAEIDPVIVSAHSWRFLPLRPVVLEKYYYLRGSHFLLKWIEAIPMPDMETEPGPFKRRRVERAMQDAAGALKKGDAVLLYPAGRIMVSGVEKLGGASGVHRLLRECPGVDVVLIRSKGLYGSSFSKALTGGRSPDFYRTLLTGLKILLKNLLLFVPKRAVTVEYRDVSKEIPRSASPIELNRWLESWYNESGPEPVTLVSRAFWREDLPDIRPAADAQVELADVPPQIVTEVIDKVASVGDVPREKVSLESRLGEELGLDSLAAADLLTWLNERYGAGDVDMRDVTTVGAIVRAAAGSLSAIQPLETFKVPERWFEDPAARPEPKLTEAASIPEAFLRTAKRMGSSIAMADEKSGIVNWNKALVAALLLRPELARVAGRHVGILLPASVGASLCTAAAMLAGKVPVMLNWTAGKRNVEHAVEVCDIRCVLTSKAFLDLVDTDLEYLEDRFLFLEDLRKRAGLPAKIRALMESRLSADRLVARTGTAAVRGNETAVVLFTSGSEADPKDVPLTHRNILSNIEGGFEVMNFSKEDVLYAFLPPFHSFGLTVCSLVPLVAGLKAVFHPNPNESRRLALGCEKWRVSVMAGTPTFLRSILRAGEPHQFLSMRAVVSGAEKAPEELFEAAERKIPQAAVLEGYGITECSPIVSANRIGEPRSGVGRPLKDVRILIVHHETLKPLPEGERGLILISGPNVFPGYLGGRASPFVHVEGTEWYNSGDLGYLQNGALHISGRLKRFIKIGGEMVSLTAVEESLSKAWPTSADEGPVLAVTAVEREGVRPELHLFTTKGATVEAANEVLSRDGFPNLVKITEVHRLGALPVLGSGKTDVQSLKKMLKE